MYQVHTVTDTIFSSHYHYHTVFYKLIEPNCLQLHLPHPGSYHPRIQFSFYSFLRLCPPLYYLEQLLIFILVTHCYNASIHSTFPLGFSSKSFCFPFENTIVVMIHQMGLLSKFYCILSIPKLCFLYHTVLCCPIKDNNQHHNSCCQCPVFCYVCF